MKLKNSETRFGVVAKTFHWSMAALFLYQYLGANVMTRLGNQGVILGMDGNFFYDWHKSIGLVLLLLVVARWVWRRATALPDWPDSLSTTDRQISHRLETGLYWLMLILPITGYLFVMAGGYGVKLFGVVDLPNPIGKQPSWSGWVWSMHIAFAYAAVVVISWHVGLGIRKHVFEKTGLLNRMLPFRR